MEHEEKNAEPSGNGKGKSDAAAETLAAVERLDQLILDTAFNKYDIILLARRWAYELKSKEGETRTLQDLIAVAIRDILSSRVNHKMVRDLPYFRAGKKPKAANVSLLDAIAQVPKGERAGL